jgi:hypothetical protein
VRKLILASLLLILLWTSATSAAVLNARQQPGSVLLSALQFDRCAPPCWIGIIPGKTTMNEARNRVIGAFGDPTSDYLLVFEDNASPHLLWVNLQERQNSFGIAYITLDSGSDNVVDTISISFQSIYVSRRPTIADFHRLLGAPAWIKMPDEMIQRADSFGLIYGSDDGGELLAVGFPDWTDQPAYVVFFAPDRLPLPLSSQLRQWRGFGFRSWRR